MSKNYTISEIIDKFEEILVVCKLNNDIYKNNKEEMMVKIREYDPVFYNRHYRICKTIVYEDDITELLAMLEKLHEIQTNKASLEEKDKEISNKYNAKYVNPILNKKELVEERNKKMQEYNLT